MKHWVEGFLAGCCALSMACTPEAKAVPPRAPRAPLPVPGNSAAGSSASPKSAPKDAAAELTVAGALAFVSSLRALPATQPVKARVITRDEMVSRVEHEVDEEVPPPVVQGSGEILFALGAVPASFNYRQGLLDVMRSELLGFYEPHEKTMFLSADLHGQELDATLWHELVHALQDQHYGLEKLLNFSADAGDWQGAVHALAEGDATSAMFDAMFADKGLRAPDVPDSMMNLQAALSAGVVQQVPPIIKRSVIAPYVDGLAFVNEARRRGGWQAVDAIWSRLPQSTEQVLHFEKYQAQELPESIPLLAPGAVGPSAATYSDIYGEEALRILFEEWMPARAAHEAASGWAGDRITAFSDPAGATSVAWLIRYDSDAAALGGLHAFARGALAVEDQALDSRGRLSEFVSAAAAERATVGGQVCRERHTRGPFAVYQRERDVVVTLGPFRRNSASALSDGKCTDALKWAAALATQGVEPSTHK